MGQNACLQARITFLFLANHSARAVKSCSCKLGRICTSLGTHIRCFFRLTWHNGRIQIDVGVYIHCHPMAYISAGRAYERAKAQSDATRKTHSDLCRIRCYTSHQADTYPTIQTHIAPNSHISGSLKLFCHFGSPCICLARYIPVLSDM